MCLVVIKFLLFQSQQFYFKMTLMQLRSKSAQQRRQQRGTGQLLCKLNWIIGQKYPSMQVRNVTKMAEKQVKNDKFSISKLQASIQKVESIENMQFMGMKSAIQELQDLTTPRYPQENFKEYRRNMHNKEQIPQSFYFQEGRTVFLQQDTHSRNKNENQTAQYYKGECEQLKSQLNVEKTKNQDLMAIVKRLEHNNVQLEKEIDLLIQKWQREHSASAKIGELQQNFKQQLVFNLELEQILLKQKLELQKKHYSKEQKSQQRYKTIIKELKHRFKENKEIAQKEVNTLKEIIEEKEKEIAQLKQIIKRLNEQAKEKIRSLNQIEFHSNKVGGNFIQRFVNFSKEMQVKLSQYQMVSTNPSLEDVPMMDLQPNRKHSQSIYSKGCPSVQIPLSLVKDVNQKAASKTDRI